MSDLDKMMDEVQGGGLFMVREEADTTPIVKTGKDSIDRLREVFRNRRPTEEIMELPPRLPVKGDVLICLRALAVPSGITYQIGDTFLLLEKAGNVHGRESSLGNWLVKDSRLPEPSVWAKIEYLMVKGTLFFEDEVRADPIAWSALQTVLESRELGLEQLDEESPYD